MARSLIRGGQVVDEDFVSHGEHGDPSEVPHTFLLNIDTPATYSGASLKLTRVNEGETGVEFVDPSEVLATVSGTGQFYNLDGGDAFTTYGGTTSIDAGNAFTTY